MEKWEKNSRAEFLTARDKIFLGILLVFVSSVAIVRTLWDNAFAEIVVQEHSAFGPRIGAPGVLFLAMLSMGIVAIFCGSVQLRKNQNKKR